MICDFDYHTKAFCTYKKITAEIQTVSLALEDDEKQISSIDVSYQRKKQTLSVTVDTTIFEDDKGYLSFEDINFDGFPDIAITTSFGLANLYLDYWVFNPQKNTYVKLGNYGKFSVDSSSKTLNNVIKINAENYEKNIYYWAEYKLIKQP